MVDTCILGVHETLDTTGHVDRVGGGGLLRSEGVHRRTGVEGHVRDVGVAGHCVGKRETRVVALLVPSVGQAFCGGKASVDVVAGL